MLISSSVIGCDLRGLLPLPFCFSTFCLAFVDSRVSLKASSWYMIDPAIEWPYLCILHFLSILLTIDLKVDGSYSPPSFYVELKGSWPAKGQIPLVE